MSKHTPGPWNIAEPGPKQKSRWIHDVAGWPIAYARISLEGQETTNANAHLISASPDLLSALEAVWDLRTQHPDAPGNESAFDSMWEKVDQAIKKARGE